MGACIFMFFATIIIITSTAQNHQQLKASIKGIINAIKKTYITYIIWIYNNSVQREGVRGERLRTEALHRVVEKVLFNGWQMLPHSSEIICDWMECQTAVKHFNMWRQCAHESDELVRQGSRNSRCKKNSKTKKQKWNSNIIYIYMLYIYEALWNEMYLIN